MPFDIICSLSQFTFTICWDSKYKRAAKNTPAITASIFIIRFNINPIKKPTIPPKPIVLTNGIMLLSIPLIFFAISSFFGGLAFDKESKGFVIIEYKRQKFLSSRSRNGLPQPYAQN